ncbi:DUF3168 domain-containing protein [Bacillus sp. IITD106]|nr:DUF3168 domain-containing protein [Bacillus sp. IITD106]
MAVDLKSPQQQVFDAVFLASFLLGYKTFDYLPAKETTYPFVYIGEQTDQDRRTKSLIYGRVQQTIHIYHDYKKRRELTTMMDKLKVECRKLKQTENFYLTFKNITSRTLIDTSTGEPLLHGVIEVEFQFN